RCVRDYLEAFEARRPFVLEYRLRHRDGEYQLIRDLGRPRFTASGEFSGYIGGCVDVTERAEAVTRLRAFMNNSPSIMFVKDLQGRYLNVNDQFARSFGLDRRSIISRTDEDIFPPDQANQFRATDARVLAIGAPIETEETVSLKDGLRTHIVCKFPIADAKGTIIALGGIRTDITERERAGREIRASRELLRSLASRLNAVREEERRSIALNLHDELGQALTSAKIDLSLLEQAVRSHKKPPSRAHILRELRSAKRTVDKAIGGLRRIAAELRPAVLNELGLAAAIDWLVKDFEKHARVKCKVVLPNPFQEPDKERATALYRILQETLTNIARHAGAKTVEIALKVDEGQYVLEVRDDGVGIPAHRLNDWGSLGLSGMRERALTFDGQVAIDRGPDGGTTVTASIPSAAGVLP
ncbi:MAG TPA: PAS domain-containing protein, partial [Burkholderiales bacterium]|nr:PAS domain-containing protein [Burkholderiales bacterium]